MIRRFLFASCLLITANAFADDAPAKLEIPSSRKMGHAKPIVFNAEREVYGKEPSSAKPIALSELLKDSERFSGKQVAVSGKIKSVCPKKGCWMVLEENGKEMRVRFKKYSFFVPMDVEGREVSIEGIFELKVEKEAMRRHYAEDAGKTKEEIQAIKGDVQEPTFTADAVSIRAK